MPTNQGFLPETVVAGETIWIAAANTLQSSEDIIIDGVSPAAGYTLVYQFSAPTPITVTATSNGANTGWTLEVTGAQTLVWAPGVIQFVGLASIVVGESTRSYAVDAGAISVAASPLRVSSWVAVLAAVDAAIVTYAANPNGTISMDGISISYRTLDQLTALRDYVNYRLTQDNAARPKRIIRTEFTIQ
jgi:hypothetical protein